MIAIQFEVYRTESGKWRWLIRSQDTGRVMARSEKSWDHPGNCHREIIQVKQDAIGAGTFQPEPAKFFV